MDRAHLHAPVGHRLPASRLGLCTAVLLTFAVAADPTRAQEVCASPEARLAPDHVVVAVPDLAVAERQYVDLGFTPKPGRMHANGISNTHFEFRDGTELELITVVGPAGDAIADDYERLIRAGGGGAFLALRAEQQPALEAAREQGLGARRLDASPFRYVTFADAGIDNLFTIEYERLQASDPLPSQPNGALGLTEVWMEGADALAGLLRAMGARECGPLTSPGGIRGRAFGVANGAVVLVAPPTDGRRRVLGTTIASDEEPAEPVVAEDRAQGIWLRFQVAPAPAPAAKRPLEP